MTRYLVLYLSVGTGHQAAARAIRSAIEEIHPHADVLLIDPLAQVWDGFPQLLSTLSAVPLFITPQLYDRLWRDGEDRGFVNRLLDASPSQAAVRSLVAQIRPDAVIATHAFPLRLLTGLRGPHRRSLPPMYGVPTDFGLHAYWPTHGVRRYFVASNAQRAELIRRGVSPARVAVTGIPIAPNFSSPVSVEAARSRFRLQDDLPMVTLVAGSIRSGPYAATQLLMDRVLQEFNRRGTNAQFVVVCGRNTLLRQYLRRRTADFSVPARVLGFVDDMPSLLGLTSLLVTKPGGLTTAEALACGLPMVLLRPGPGQEEANARFLVGSGAALPGDSAEQVVDTVESLLADSDRLTRMAIRSRELGRPRAAYQIAEEISTMSRPSSERPQAVHP